MNPVSVNELAKASGFSVARIETARVKFHEKHDTPRVTYAAGKAVAELLNWPARICGRGHDLLAFLQRH